MTYTPKQIRAMLDAATPGPMVAIQADIFGEDNTRWSVCHAGERQYFIATIENGLPGDTLETEQANAELFAAAPTIIRELLTENERLRSALQPFANFACDPRTRTRPCDCHNCVARAALEDDQ